MRWNWKYAFITLLILLAEIAIALFVHDRFIRPFVGDLLVVVLLYFGFRTILKAARKSVAIGVLIFALIIEGLQYFNLVELLGLAGNRLASIVLGSTFDWLDLLAYLLGTGFAYYTDQKFFKATPIEIAKN